MHKRKAELVDTNGAAFAQFNETCHAHGATVATVRLHTPITLQGTEMLELFAKGNSHPVLTVEASDPAGTEIREFHGTSAIGCLADGTGLSLVKSPGGDLGTLLIVLATGTLKEAH